MLTRLSSAMKRVLHFIAAKRSQNVFYSTSQHGDYRRTCDVKINREPARLTWRDEDTLVIEPNDARRIIRTGLTGTGMLSSICADADGGTSKLDRRTGRSAVGIE